MTRAVGVTVTKNTSPMMIGLVILWRSRPNRIHWWLRGARMPGTIRAAARNSPATISAQIQGLQLLIRGNSPTIRKTAVKTIPKARSVDPLISSSRVMVSWTAFVLLSVMTAPDHLIAVTEKP